MAVDAPAASGRWVRVGAFVALLALATFLLPVSAYTVEAISARAENWIIAMQLTLMAGFGAALGAASARLGPRRWSTPARIGTWAGVGLAAAFVADGAWLLLLTG